MSVCGGFTNQGRPATADEQAILDVVKGAVEASSGKSFSTFRAHSFITQVVAGTIYVMKVEADGEYLHVKIVKPLPHTGNPPQLMQMQGGLAVDSPLVPL